MGKLTAVILAAICYLAVVKSWPQQGYGGPFSRPRPIRDNMEFNIMKLLSSIASGGRGHRELLGAASTLRNEYRSAPPPSSSSLSPSALDMILAAYTRGNSLKSGPPQYSSSYDIMEPPTRDSKAYYYRPESVKGNFVRKPSLSALRASFSSLRPSYSLGGGGPISSLFGGRPSLRGPPPPQYSSQSSPYSSQSSPYSSSLEEPYSAGADGSYTTTSVIDGPAYETVSNSPYSSSSPSSSPSSSSSSSPYIISSSSPSSQSSPYTISSSAFPQFSQIPNSAFLSESSSPASGSPTSSSSDENLSIQEIVSKAAREQHQKIMERERLKHPDAIIQGQFFGSQQPGGISSPYQQIIGFQPAGLAQSSPSSGSDSSSQIISSSPPQQQQQQPQFVLPQGLHPSQIQQVLIMTAPNGQQYVVSPHPQQQPLIQLAHGQAQPGHPQQQQLSSQVPFQHQIPLQYFQQPQQQQVLGIHPQQQQQQGIPQLYTIPNPGTFFGQTVPQSQYPSTTGQLLTQAQLSIPLNQHQQQQLNTNQIYTSSASSSPSSSSSSEGSSSSSSNERFEIIPSSSEQREVVTTSSERKSDNDSDDEPLLTVGELATALMKSQKKSAGESERI